jgi:hypothetical protein
MSVAFERGKVIAIRDFFQQLVKRRFRTFTFYGVIVGNWAIGITHWEKGQQS